MIRSDRQFERGVASERVRPVITEDCLVQPEVVRISRSTIAVRLSRGLSQSAAPRVGRLARKPVGHTFRQLHLQGVIGRVAGIPMHSHLAELWIAYKKILEQPSVADETSTLGCHVLTAV